MQQHYEQALGRYAQQLTHLAVQIARKILWSKVEQGDYEIEKIVTQLLQAADSNGQNVTVRLNPADIAGCEKMLEPMDNCRFIADENVAKAECVVETEDALVESRIEQGLARIEKSLQKAN